MKKISLYIATALLMLGSASCSDKLNELPSQSKVDGNLIVDQKTAQIALNGIYYQYAQCGIDNYDIETTNTCQYYEVMPGDMAGLVTYYQGEYMLETHPGSYADMYNGYLWQVFYQTVTAANAVIDQLESANDSWFTTKSKAQFLAEARLMRALAYSKLMMWFAYYWDESSPYGLVIRDEAVVATNLPCERSSVKESYDFILSDIDYAIANAVDQNDNYYTNKQVAKGLKARILMMRGQYAEAAAICQEIIGSGAYSLEPVQTDIFHQLGLESQEVMFGIQPKENQTANYEAYYYRGGAQYLPTDAYAALFADDPRMEENFVHTVDSSLYLLYLQYGYGEFPEYIVDSYIVCKHLTPYVYAPTTVEETNVEMRLSEIYLMRAEALAHQGFNQESVELLKEVLTRAGYTDFSTTADLCVDQHSLLEQIFNETLRNVGLENGLEMPLMMRMPKDIVIGFNPYYADETGEQINAMYSVLGLPANEFKYNTALKESDQNPGYSTASAE